MSILRFFDQDIVVRRLRDVDSTRSSFQATATADGHIQSLSREARQALGILEERAWIAWFREDADIKEGDRLTDKDGDDYQVREVTTKDYGINQHKEVILAEINE